VTFSREQIERGRSYHRPRYLSELADFVLGVALLSLLAFTGVGDALLPDWSWWAQALVYPTIVLALLTLVRFPISYWRDYAREHRWGLSTQSLGGWLTDVAKAFAVSALLVTILLFGLVALARWTDAWPLVAAPLAAGFVVFFTFVAPVVLEPIFNKFKPLEDQELADDLRGLSERVGVPVRDVLVADASRRTTKSNAYVSGFGATRRVVLYDTLLQQMKPAELRAVLAHELAHRKHGDIVRLSALLVGAAVGLVVLLWAVLGDEASDPRSIPLAMLVVMLAAPVVFAGIAAYSRRAEYRADRFALDATRNLAALEGAFTGLVDANVADLEPPRVVYYLKYTHPTVVERLDALRRTARDEGLEAA
jgi:Zn-dependent protease with chaperone function